MTQAEFEARIQRGDIIAGGILVETNVFNIPERLKAIDKGYFVVFRPYSQRYELHHEEQDFTLCTEFPYDELDSRAIDYAKKTRIENIDIIMEEMKKKNEKIENDRKESFLDKVGEIAKDIHRYARRSTGDGGIDKGAYKTRFV